MPVGEKHTLRFGPFQLDTQFGQLSKGGVVLKLQGQPVQILEMLLEKPAELVTREELRQRLWPSDTFVDFDHSLNTAIKKLRQTLNDEADMPRYIQTLPKRGYRFIASVENSDVPSEAEQLGVLQSTVETPAKPSYGKTAALSLGVLAVVVLVVLIILDVGHLRDRSTGTSGPRIQSLAVLPMENLSSDPQQDYFADGMTDALISEVGQIGSLRVISRTSVRQYKRTQKSLPRIARELNVDALVEGTVLRSGDRVRVTAQLIGAVPERHLWARSYDRDLRDVLTLQSEVARAIAEEVQAEITPDVQARLSRVRSVNPEAHELFLKGIYSSDTNKALEYVQQAIQKDPNFAQAYLGGAFLYINVGELNKMASQQAFAMAKDYARRALKLDETLADAHRALGIALSEGDWNWSGSELEFKRAFALNPNSADAHCGYGFSVLMFMGRFDEAIAEFKRCQDLSPGPGEDISLAFGYSLARRYDEALAQVKKAEEVMPDCCKEMSPFVRGTVYREKGMYKDAFTELQKVPMPVVRLGHLGNAYARAGKKAEAYKNIQKLMEFTKEGLGTYELALIYSGLGEKNEAFDWLERAYKTHDKGMCYLKIDAALDPLHSDPRFQDLLRRMKLPQ